MKKLLLIMGDLATGKSTFANMLSKRYDTVLFCKDPIKERLSEYFGYSNRAENLNLSHATAGMLYLIFSEFAQINQDLILESNFRISELEQLHRIASENDYQVLTLVLRGDVKILHKRYLNRMTNENRPAVHLCPEFNTIEGFAAYLESLKTGPIPGDVIYIDANEFAYQTDMELLKKIDGFMAG